MADPISLLLLGTLGGAGAGLGSWLLNKIPGLGPSAENINQDYVNNPIWKQLFGTGGDYARMSGGMDSFLQNAVSSAKSYDPTAFWKDFMAAQPEMQNIVSGATGSFESAAKANLADFVKEATAGTAQELSGMGSLYSGALGQIAGQKIGAEAGKSNTELASLAANLLGNLHSGALSGFSSGRQFGAQNLMQAYLGGAQTYSQQLASMLGIGADLSAPVYMQQPGLGDAILGGMGAGISAGTGLGMLGGKTAPAAATNPSMNNLGALQMYKALGLF